MRNRIAVWGRDAQEKRVLITIELQVSDNIVRIQTYPEKVVTDEVYKLFMDKWRKGHDEGIPEADRVIARELSVTEGLLPDDLKAEQTDMILRAQTEWHFHVLSDKLAQNYKAELAEIEDRVDRATQYSSDLWNQAKTFWQKIQSQLQDKTLLREQGNEIRKRVDVTFEKLKTMREKLNEQYKEESTKQVAKFGSLLQDAETRIGEGTHLNKVFNDLRDIQRKFHNVKFTKEDRDAIYNRIDAAFKAVKNKRGQGGDNKSGAIGRTEARLQGLMKAIERMKSSLGRDQNDLKFERRRIEKTDGQLEKQIRQAKVVMIESRMNSKQVKLDDMEKTRAMLEKKIEQEKKKAEKRAKKDAERAAAQAAKAKIAGDIASKSVSPEEAAKLQAAAEAIKAGKKKGGRTKPEDRTPPQVANYVAYSEIVTGDPKVSDWAEQAGDGIATAIASVGGIVNDTVEAVTEEGGIKDQAEGFLGSMLEKLEDAVEDVTDTVRAVAQVAAEKFDDAADAVEDKVADVAEAASEKFDAAADAVEDTVSDVAETAAEKINTAADAVEDTVADVVDEANEKISGEEE